MGRFVEEPVLDVLGGERAVRLLLCLDRDRDRLDTLIADLVAQVEMQVTAPNPGSLASAAWLLRSKHVATSGAIRMVLFNMGQPPASSAVSAAGSGRRTLLGSWGPLLTGCL
jgi:hypothetical protein